MSSNKIYPATSPYFDTPISNNKFLDFMTYRDFPASPDDILYTIPAVYEYRPDMCAYDFYSDARLWWVFAARNPNKLGPDPYFNFKAGVSIYIPKLDVLRTYLRI
jgi:hypothetical protein